MMTIINLQITSLFAQNDLKLLTKISKIDLDVHAFFSFWWNVFKGFDFTILLICLDIYQIQDVVISTQVGNLH